MRVRPAESRSKPGKGHVTVAVILGSYRYFVGSVLAFLCAAPGCSNLIGLNGYSVGGLGGEPEGRIHNDAGRSGAAAAGDAASGGYAGALIGDAGSGGNSASSAGRAGASGA